jgi:hypothetical protein
MSYQNLLTVPRRRNVFALAALLGVVISLRGVAAASPPEGLVQQKVVVGRTGLAGLLFHREGANNAWHLLGPAADVYSEDLIVALPAGVINSKSKNVRLTLLSDLARTSPYPVLESAVVLHETDVDLDFTLERGRVDVTNTQKTDAKIRVRFQKEVWDLTLGDKAKVAFELYGRWPAGMHFNKTPKPDEKPTLDVVLLVKEGKVTLKTGTKEFPMAAPPEEAYFHWDSVPPFLDTPEKLKELPKWAKPLGGLPAFTGDLGSLVKVLTTRPRERPTSVEEALATLLASESEPARHIAVYGLGALDDLPQLIDALSTSKLPDVRDVTVIALRHWIGRGEGQDMKLYDALVKKGYSEKNATRVMQLLHSFGNVAKASPATYETLIEFLTHENAAVRQLAHWHLVRLAPAAKITYDPLSSPEELKAAQAKWKELIPTGKLPPKPKAT